MADKTTKPKTSSTKEVAGNEKEKSASKPKKKTALVWILVGVALVVAAVIALFFVKRTPAPDDPKNSPSYSSAFFIYADGKYSLWNKDGVRLTVEQYDEKSNFVGGYAYVKMGNEYALIHESGRVTVPFGQISQLVQSYAGLFLVEDNAGTRKLINGEGKELLAGEDLTIDSPGYSSPFLYAKLDDHYYIYNYQGKLITDFVAVKDADNDIRFSTESDFALAFYNGSNLLFDARDGKQLAFFEGERYSISGVADDRATILLEKYDDEDYDYKLIRGGQVYDLTEAQYYGMVTYSDLIIGYDDSYEKVYLLDSNYKIAAEVSDDSSIKDLAHYAFQTEDGNVEIHNGASVVMIEDAELVSSVIYNVDLYTIKKDGKYGFYRLDGSFAFGGYEDVYSAFNRFGRASVSDDGENYYLIDGNGKKIDENTTFTKIYTYEHSASVRNNDYKWAILDGNGMRMTEFAYEDVDRRSSAVDHEIWTLEKEDSKEDVFDVTTGKFILTDVKTYDFYANYFVVRNEDDKKEFYNYEGLKFYTEE